MAVTVNSSTFPDANFRNYVLQNITGGSTTLTDAKINSTTYLNCANKSISNIKGYEYFSKLTTLNLGYNNLTTLDILASPKIKELICYNNNLTSINVTKATSLEMLACQDNKLASLDLSKNTKLESLNCRHNNITSVDVTNCPNLLDENILHDDKTKIIRAVVPTISTTSLSYGVKGNAYSLQLSASGTTPITWSASNLPAGLSCNSSGKISGTPTTTGTKSVTIKATNAGGSASKSINLTVYEKPTITTSSLPAGVNGVAYSTQLAASGSATITYSASNLPTGLSCNTSGKISGTPTATGTKSVTIAAKNSYGTATKSLNLVINQKPAISTTSLSNGYKGEAYSLTLSATGTTPFEWTATCLPSGLSLGKSNGKITGTPSATGSSSVTITCKNVAGSVSKTLTLAIYEKPAVTTTSLANAFKGESYSATLSATGTATVTISVSGLPNGLSFSSSTNKITGTPTATGASTVTITAKNSYGTATKSLTLNVYQKPAITTTSLPAGVNGTAYSTTLAATGTATLTWTVTNLPTGLSFSSSTLKITGTPTKTETKSVSITVKNSYGTATKSLNLVINQKPAITTSSLPAGINDVAYSQTLTATGTTPYTWGASNLPSGLSINASTGIISGTPNKTETKTATITLSNVAGNTSKDIQIVINEKPVITTASFNMTIPGIFYYAPNTATGTTPYTWSASGLPSGLSIDASTGVISGTPKVSGDFTFNINVKNIAGSYDKALSLHIEKLPESMQLWKILSNPTYKYTTKLVDYIPQDILKNLQNVKAKVLKTDENETETEYSNGVLKSQNLIELIEYEYAVKYADNKTYTLHINTDLRIAEEEEIMPEDNYRDYAAQLRNEVKATVEYIKNAFIKHKNAAVR